MTELAVDSAVYFGVIYLRDYLARQNNWRSVFGQTERLWRTGVFAAASMGWDMLPSGLYDAFMYAGEKIAAPELGLCAKCQAKNLYIVFIQFLVNWFRKGMMRTSDELWSALDEYIRLIGTDYISGSVRPMLLGNAGILKNNMYMTRSAQLLPGQVITGSNAVTSNLYVN